MRRFSRMLQRSLHRSAGRLAEDLRFFRDSVRRRRRGMPGCRRLLRPVLRLEHHDVQRNRMPVDRPSLLGQRRVLLEQLRGRCLPAHRWRLSRGRCCLPGRFQLLLWHLHRLPMRGGWFSMPHGGRKLCYRLGVLFTSLRSGYEHLLHPHPLSRRRRSLLIRCTMLCTHLWRGRLVLHADMVQARFRAM